MHQISASLYPGSQISPRNTMYKNIFCTSNDRRKTIRETRCGTSVNPLKNFITGRRLMFNKVETSVGFVVIRYREISIR